MSQISRNSQQKEHNHENATCFAWHDRLVRGVIRSSGNMRDGYFGIRDAAQKPMAEVKFGPLTAYRRLEVRFTPAYSGWHNIFAGFWATGKDVWIQIDDIQLMAPCNDVILKPADN